MSRRREPTSSVIDPRMHAVADFLPRVVAGEHLAITARDAGGKAADEPSAVLMPYRDYLRLTDPAAWAARPTPSIRAERED